MDVLRSILFLLMCTVLQLALGRATETDINVGIIGGRAIEIEDAPFMAGFLQGGSVVCAGSIVHQQFILTSASCVKSKYPITIAHVGSKLARKNGDFIYVEDMVCHKEFDRRTLENDICLLKLKTPLLLGNGTATVELPVENINTASGTVVNVTGWGSLDNADENYPINLQQTTMAILGSESCFPNTQDNTQNTLCAGLEARDACTGDGGGPLTQNNVQLGIVSLTRCGTFPTVYTKVSKYVTWIRTTIRNNL